MVLPKAQLFYLLMTCTKLSNFVLFITADDTNLFLIDKSLKKINKHINRDLKLIVDWIGANKLSLNTSKTEIVIFKPRNKIELSSQV